MSAVSRCGRPQSRHAPTQTDHTPNTQRRSTLPRPPQCEGKSGTSLLESLPRSPHRSPRAANGAAALFAATTRRLSGAVTLVCVCERCLTCFYDTWGRTGSIVAHAAPRTAVPSRRPPNGEPRVSAAAPVRPCHATVGPWRLRRGFLGSGRSEYTTSRC